MILGGGKRYMKRLGTLAAIGMISGIVLALFLKIIELITANQVYYLLFDTSYIPILNELYPIWLIEVTFHFTTCVISIIALYYLLRYIQLEKSIITYVFVIGIGSGLLYFLTLLSEKTPHITDIATWIYWIVGHALFSLTAGYLIRKWVE